MCRQGLSRADFGEASLGTRGDPKRIRWWLRGQEQVAKGLSVRPQGAPSSSRPDTPLTEVRRRGPEAAR